jgi:hypothetical protein
MPAAVATVRLRKAPGGNRTVAASLDQETTSASTASPASGTVNSQWYQPATGPSWGMTATCSQVAPPSAENQTLTSSNLVCSVPSR